MNLNKNILALLFVACSSTALLAQTQPAATPAAEESKLKFVDKLNHWFTAYGISSNDFLTAERNTFKRSAYAEAYIQAMIDHPSWMFTMLNKVTEFRFDAKQDPHIIFDIKFKPDANITSYQVQVVVRGSQTVTGVDLAGISAAVTVKYFGGKTYPDPLVAMEPVAEALREVMLTVATALGDKLSPNLMVKYKDEIFWNGHHIDVLEGDGNTIDLEPLGKNGVALNAEDLTWINADKFMNKGLVDLRDVDGKQVTLTKRGDNTPMTVTVGKVSASQEIRGLLKELIVEALGQKKQRAIDSVALLKTDSANNETLLLQKLASLEAGNFPMEAGTSAVALFADGARYMTVADSAAFNTGADRKEGFRLLRKRRSLRQGIRRKVNVVAFANLVVDQPDKLELLLEELLRNSGRLLAQLILNTNQQGQRDAARNIVVDFLNKNIERIAGGAFGFAQAVEPPLKITVPPPTQSFSATKYLYYNDKIAFEGKQEFFDSLNLALQNRSEKLYVFINYSQDVNAESYQARLTGLRPIGISAGKKFIVLSLVNIPGSVKVAAFGSDNNTVPISITESKKTISYYLKRDESLFTDETQSQEVARIINYIKCAKIKTIGNVAVHYGYSSYNVRVGDVKSLLNFGDSDMISSPELLNSTLSVSINTGALSQDDIIIGYKDIVLDLSTIQYVALQKVQISAAAGGVVFRFPQITDPVIKQLAFDWLRKQLAIDGSVSSAFAVNNNRSYEIDDILLYSECELEQLNRANRESLIVKLLEEQETLSLDNDTYQYLLLYVLQTVPSADRLHFYNFFKDTPSRVKNLYYQISDQNKGRLVAIWSKLWGSFYENNTTSTGSSGKLVITNNMFGNAGNAALLEDNGNVLFLQPYRHGNYTDTHFRVSNPFDAIYLYQPEVNPAEPFVTIPAIAALYFLEGEHKKTRKDELFGALQVALFAVGAGEVVVGLRGASVALQGSGVLSREFLMAGIKTSIGTADILAGAASSYCNDKTSEFCVAWKKYEFYINLGLLTASVVDGVFNKLQLEYPNVRNELSDENKRILDDVLLAKAWDEIVTAFKSRLTSKVQSTSGFTIKHNDAEIKAVIQKGKNLNLADDVIDDMLFISCRDVKAINASELMTQMDNWVNVVSKRGYPYKFNDIGQFNSFKNELKTGLNDINVTTSDVRIQGSSLRTPNANDVDLAAIISETDFDNFLVNRFNNKIIKNGTAIDLSNKSKQQLIDIANDYNLNPSLYNNQAKSFSKSILDRKVSAYSNDKVIPGFKELYNSVKSNYPNLNIENITIQTSGGIFDLKPFVKL